MPGVFGVLARWGPWGLDTIGKHASVCVWLDESGHSRCTYVELNVHQDNCMHERPTTCHHVGVFDAMLFEIAACLGADLERVKKHVLKGLSEGEDGPRPVEGITFHVLGALYVAVCPTAFGTLPVPVYLTATRSSCGICPGARTRVCTRLSVAQESGAPQKAHRASAQSAVRSLELASVSELPIPLHDCIAAVRANAVVRALALSGGEFELKAPRHCRFCAQRDVEHELLSASIRVGVVACTRGFCRMKVNVAKCSSCKQWVSQDGRGAHIVMLSTTSAATVTWARSMASGAAEGTALTTAVTRWLRTVHREVAAGVLPSSCPTRSGRVLRNIVMVALKLMVAQLPLPLFTCIHCMDADGRYKCVSADSIWVGFGSGADHMKFEHVTENVPENRQAVRAAYLVRGESVRRVLRDLLKPRKDVKLLARTVRAAEIAVGLLLPDALPPDRKLDRTNGEVAISSLLDRIIDLRAAASSLLGALKVALTTFKTRDKVEAARRSAAAVHLGNFMKSVPVTERAAAPTSAGTTSEALPPSACSTSRSTPLVQLPVAPSRPSAPSVAGAVRSMSRVCGVSDVAPSPSATTRRRPDCGRKPFKAGKGDVDTDSSFLRPAVKKLDKDSKRELLSFVTAITIDSVALPFRPRHSVVLRRVSQVLSGENPSRELHRLLALATSDQSLEDIEDSKPVVDLLRDLRLVQLGLRSCKPLFAHLSGLSSALAGSLLCVADAIDLFVLEWRNGPELSRQYQQRWYGGDRSQAALSHEFKMAYPTASGKHEVTGMCAPSLPQCRPEPFLWEEVLSTGMCSKHYAKAHKFSPGAMTFCCGCKHPLILAFSVLDRKEAPQVLLNMLLTRFARLPHFLVYDFACGAFRVALGKIGWLLMDCTILSDRFHIFNHLCSDAFDRHSYAHMDGVDSGAPEQRNVPIRRIQTTLQGMGVVPYTNLLAFQTGILNHEAQCRWKLGVERLPDDVDLAGEYFKVYPCHCCDEDEDEDASRAGWCGDMSDGDLGVSDGSSGLSASSDALKTDDEGEVSVRINAGKSGSALSEDVSAPASDAESSSSGGDDSAPDSVGE